MNNLLEIPKTHVIITQIGGHYQITQDQYNALQKKEMDEELILEGGNVKLRQIAEVPTIKKYYEMFPNKIPTQTSKYKKLPSAYQQISYKEGILGIIKGINKYIQSEKYQGTIKPKEILKQACIKYKIAK